MKNLALAFTLIASSLTFGIYDPNWERPILKSTDMKITEARFGFAKLSRVDLTLTRRDGNIDATGMKLNLIGESKDRVVELEVYNVLKDDCGSIIYSAHLKNEESEPAQHRFHVRLTDHYKRICEDYRPYRWEAEVREGYGFCGTMDSTMILSGNPEPVNTIR